VYYRFIDGSQRYTRPQTHTNTHQNTTTCSLLKSSAPNIKPRYTATPSFTVTHHNCP